jgi:hypothetical protein
MLSDQDSANIAAHSSASLDNRASIRARAANLLRRGRALEQAGSPAALDEAVRSHDRAIKLLLTAGAHDDADPSLRAELAVAWMNRGNALQRRASRVSLSAAVSAYDRALALFDECPPSDAVLNRRGAAWLNRTCALAQFDGPQALLDALDSADRAIAILGALPLDADVNHRINLAGAWLNRADLLLRAIGSPDRNRHDDALAAARASLETVAPLERENIAAAALALRARRVWLAALDETHVSLASDLVDDGLALARDWIARGATALRSLARELFRAGSFLYAERQPQFLTEFLDEAFVEDALFGDRAASHAVASEALARAEGELNRRWLAPTVSEPMLPLLETLSSLAAFRARLA